MLEAAGTVALGVAPAESPPATRGVPRAGWVVRAGTAALASAAGAFTGAGCWSGVPEPLAAGSLVGPTNPPAAPVAVLLARGARGVRLE